MAQALAGGFFEAYLNAEKRDGGKPRETVCWQPRPGAPWLAGWWLAGPGNINLTLKRWLLS